MELIRTKDGVRYSFTRTVSELRKETGIHGRKEEIVEELKTEILERDKVFIFNEEKNIVIYNLKFAGRTTIELEEFEYVNSYKSGILVKYDTEYYIGKLRSNEEEYYFDYAHIPVKKIINIIELDEGYIINTGHTLYRYSRQLKELAKSEESDFLSFREMIQMNNYLVISTDNITLQVYDIINLKNVSHTDFMNQWTNHMVVKGTKLLSSTDNDVYYMNFQNGSLNLLSNHYVFDAINGIQFTKDGNILIIEGNYAKVYEVSEPLGSKGLEKSDLPKNEKWQPLLQIFLGENISEKSVGMDVIYHLSINTDSFLICLNNRKLIAFDIDSERIYELDIFISSEWNERIDLIELRDDDKRIEGILSPFLNVSTDLLKLVVKYF